MIKLIAIVLCCAGLSLSAPKLGFGGQGEAVWRSNLFPSAESILNRSSGRPFTVAVEGNVGSGKSTLLEYFQKYPDMAVYPEPVDVWTNLNGTDFLGLLYNGMDRWGMTFESLVQLTMAETHLKDAREAGKQTPPVKVMERSLQSARYCFIESLKNVITSPEMTILDKWYSLLRDHQQFDIDVDVIIYLRTVPEVIYERIAKRNREEEQEIPLQYFQQMHRLHEDWLMHRNTTGSKNLPPVLVIDANRDISVLGDTYRLLAKDLYKSIPKQLKTNLFFN